MGSSFKMSKQCFEELTCLLRKATLSKWKRTYCFLTSDDLWKRNVWNPWSTGLGKIWVFVCLLSLLGYVFDIQDNASNNFFSLFLAFCLSFQVFTIIFPLKRNSEAKISLWGFFFPFPWVSTWKQVSFSCSWLYPCKSWGFYSSISWHQFGKTQGEGLFQMTKLAQTEAKRIKSFKDKCRKCVPPADFGGFKILDSPR